MFPTICLGIAWCALWLLWPDVHVSAPVRRAAAPAPHYVFLSQRADDSTWSLPAVPFPLSSKYGFSRAVRDERAEELLRPVLADLAGVLKRPVAPRTTPTTAEIANLAAEMGDVLDEYEPPPVSPPAFRSEGDGSVRKVMIEFSESLSKQQFEVAQLFTNGFARTTKPWVVKAHVEIARDGNVSHVFLETPAEGGEVNSAVIRTLYRSRLKNAGAECEGQVILSWSGQRRRPGQR